MTGALSSSLRRAQSLLAPLAERLEPARRAIDLLERDLLPRTAGGDLYLVAGIVGPNNAGKSALFNALVGRALSPSLPAGGATRRLVGAAHPSLLERLRSEPTLSRFRLRLIGEDSARPEDALRPAADPAELLVAAEPDLPSGLMLIDTPDFDGILGENRLASESLLAVADLVIAVVTRHSYQNREVVVFLQHWLDHGRPWMLVYNEAIDARVARSHAAKLAADVGTAPLASFWAAHSIAVQDGGIPLEPQVLDGDRSGALRDLLFDLGEIAKVKSRAAAAAVARLRDEIQHVAATLVAEGEQARSVLDAAAARAREAGVEIASAAMPGGPFIEAFRTILDRRSNPLSRSWRATVRQIRLRLESLPRLLRGRQPSSEPGAEGADLSAFERDALRAAWPGLWEEMARDLGRETRHRARRFAPPEIARLLDADLADERRAAALARAEAEVSARPAEIEAFRGACERLVDAAIERRGFDLDIQAAADVATIFPLALAAAVIVKTGGLGIDIAVAGGGAASAFLMEKYAHLVGTGIVAEARRSWMDLRGGQIADALVDSVLEQAAPALRLSVERETTLATELRALAGALA
jgi:50S ribosome-binding GTPase